MISRRLGSAAVQFECSGSYSTAATPFCFNMNQLKGQSNLNLGYLSRSWYCSAEGGVTVELVWQCLEAHWAGQLTGSDRYAGHTKSQKGASASGSPKQNPFHLPRMWGQGNTWQLSEFTRSFTSQSLSDCPCQEWCMGEQGAGGALGDCDEERGAVLELKH